MKRKCLLFKFANKISSQWKQGMTQMKLFLQAFGKNFREDECCEYAGDCYNCVVLWILFKR